MDHITDVRGKEDGMEGFVASSRILIHEPSSSTKAPGDNGVITNEAPGGPCSASTDILPDGQGSNVSESQLFSLLLPQKAPSKLQSVAAKPNDSIGTSRDPSSRVAADAWRHTRRPRRSFAADFKLKAVAYYKQGNTKAATAKYFGIHRKRIQEWIQQESILKSSPSYKRRMTQTVVAASESERGEVQSEGSVEGADGSPLLASSTIDESDVSHTGAFTHIQTLTTLPLAAVQVSGADTQVPAGSPTAVATLGGTTTGKEVTLHNVVSAGACSSVPMLVVQPTLSTSSPISPVRATSSPHPRPSVHTTCAPPHIPQTRAVSNPIPSTHTTPPPIPPVCTTSVSALNDSSQSPSSKATREDNITFLRTLTDEDVARLLDSMNLSSYKERFLAEQVDGELLSSLRQSELRELGVESGLHQLKLLKLVQGIYSAQRFLSKIS